MQKAMVSRAEDHGGNREQRTNLSTMLQAWQEAADLQSWQRLFLLEDFPHRCKPNRSVLLGQHGCCQGCSNSCFPSTRCMWWREKHLQRAGIEQVLSEAAWLCLCFSQESRSQGRRGTRFPALLLKMYLTKALLVTKHSASSLCKEGLLLKPFKATL